MFLSKNGSFKVAPEIRDRLQYCEKFPQYKGKISGSHPVLPFDEKRTLVPFTKIWKKLLNYECEWNVIWLRFIDTMRWKFIITKTGMQKISIHHTNPFGTLVTRKLNWIVLKDVDVGIFAAGCIMGGCCVGHAFELVPIPNPYNGDKLVYFVKASGEGQHTVATVCHKSFPVSFREDAQQEFLDLLEEECIPVSEAERQEFCQWMDSFRCPHFDRRKKSLMRHLARSVTVPYLHILGTRVRCFVWVWWCAFMISIRAIQAVKQLHFSHVRR